MKWAIVIIILLAFASFVVFNPSKGQECLSYREIPERYFEDQFYAEFDTNIEEQEIILLINESGLSTNSLHIDGDIYAIASEDSIKLTNLFNSIPEIRSVVRNALWVSVEFYKYVNSDKAKKIIEEVIETNNISVINDDYSNIYLKRRSSAYIDIPPESEFNVIEWVCKFRGNNIVEDARLQSSVVRIATE